MWIKVTATTAAILSPSDYQSQWCNFVDEPEDEFVEFVNYVVDGVPKVPDENVRKVFDSIKKPEPPPPQYVADGLLVPGINLIRLRQGIKIPVSRGRDRD
jgi:hypothetical protein